MKKLIAGILTMILLTVCITPITAFAAGGSVSLSGPTVIRAGNSITVTLYLNGSGGILACNGQVTYDASKQSCTKRWLGKEFDGSL